MAASRMCQGVTKSGSPTPSEITSWPFILATSSKKSRMPLLGSVDTCPATHFFGSVLMALGFPRSGRDVESGVGRVAAVEQEALLLVTAEHEMGRRREHAFPGRKLFRNEGRHFLQRRSLHEHEQV